MVTGVSSAVAAASSRATGASLTGVTLTFTRASLVSPEASVIVYLNSSSPKKSRAGVYVTAPSVPSVAVPWRGSVTETMDRGGRPESFSRRSASGR